METSIVRNTNLWFSLTLRAPRKKDTPVDGGQPVHAFSKSTHSVFIVRSRGNWSKQLWWITSPLTEGIKTSSGINPIGNPYVSHAMIERHKQRIASKSFVTVFRLGVGGIKSLKPLSYKTVAPSNVRFRKLRRRGHRTRCFWHFKL